jgi:hypothetical protein
MLDNVADNRERPRHQFDRGRERHQLETLVRGRERHQLETLVRGRERHEVERERH